MRPLHRILDHLDFWDRNVLIVRFNKKVNESEEFSELTRIFWEANGQWALSDLLFKQIFFVKEQNNRGVGKPLVIAY